MGLSQINKFKWTKKNKEKQTPKRISSLKLSKRLKPYRKLQEQICQKRIRTNILQTYKR